MNHYELELVHGSKGAPDPKLSAAADICRSHGVSLCLVPRHSGLFTVKAQCMCMQGACCHTWYPLAD